MRNKFLNKLIAVSIALTVVTVMIPMKTEAAWINNYYGGFAYSNGYYLSTGWNMINGTWYYFNSLGVMQTGWLNSNGTWYYLDQSGAMQTGVIQVEGKIYLLGPSGGMQTGSNIINGKMYYFGPDGVCMGTDVPTPLKGYDYYGNPVQPYVPSQISNPNAVMDSNIPLENGQKIEEQYRVYYKDDDGDLILTKRIDADTKITLYEPDKAGYEFIEWNTKKNGNGTSYDAGDKVKLTGDLTLYAQWDEVETDDDSDEDTIKVTGITLGAVGYTGTTINISVGDTVQFTRKIAPSTATNTKITWSVKNGSTGKAEITSTGKLTALQPGTVTVRATATDGSKVFKEMTVIIEN